MHSGMLRPGRYPRAETIGRMLARAVPALITIPLLLAVPGQAASAAPSSRCGWTNVPGRSPGTARNILFAVTSAPHGMPWAVGDRVSPENARFVAPIIEHWNGSAWSARVMPGDQSNLLGVYAPARTNVWAVGFFIRELDNTLPVIDHFNGKTWAMVPNPRIGFGVLSGIAGTSASNIWAVGRKLARPTVTIIEHYNGSAWTRVTSPSPVSDYIDFGAIKVLSDHDIWVAGDYLNSRGISRTLIEHYDGHRWTIVPSPNVGTGDNFLSAIAAAGPHGLWAVGRASVGGRFRPLAVRFDGQAWKAQLLPAAGSGDNALNGLTQGSGRTLWAVGSATGPHGAQRTLTERYRGGHWHIVASPNANRADNILYAAARTGDRSVWAVGSWTSPSRGKVVTMRRCLQ